MHIHSAARSSGKQYLDVRRPAEGASLATSKPTAIFRPAAGRAYTLSVAIAGSIIANAKSHEQKTTLAGTIARALAVFCVDEVIIFNDSTNPTQPLPASAYSGTAAPCTFLVHLLAYLETPPYLRRFLFPMHPDLRTAGTLPSLDMPHHMRATEWSPYREGVALARDASSGGGGRWAPMLKPKFTRVETGLPFPTEVRGDIPAGARVTVRLPAGVSMRDAERAAVRAEAVGPEVPREEGGFYWGFAVRAAESLAGVWTECEWESGYDVSVGMSERGVPLAEVARRTLGADGTGAVGGAGGEEEEEEEEAAEVVGKGEGEGGVRPVSEFRHMLAVFGGVAGLEAAVAADPQLVEKGVTNPAELFEHWVDVCPGQGSRTIRTEEAVWLGLMGLREVVVAKGVKR